MDEQKAITDQPGNKETDRSEDHVNNSNKTNANNPNVITIPKDYCCCLHGWGSGPDPRWYYPWDKGVYRLAGVCCMWYCVCTAVPCVLLCREPREIICCLDQCGDNRVQTDTLEDDQVPEAS